MCMHGHVHGYLRIGRESSDDDLSEVEDGIGLRLDVSHKRRHEILAARAYRLLKSTDGSLRSKAQILALE